MTKYRLCDNLEGQHVFVHFYDMFLFIKIPHATLASCPSLRQKSCLNIENSDSISNWPLRWALTSRHHASRYATFMSGGGGGTGGIHPKLLKWRIVPLPEFTDRTPEYKATYGKMD